MDTGRAGLQTLFTGQKWINSMSLSTNQLDIRDYDVQDINGGYFNRIYRVCLLTDPMKSLIVKYAPPYIKCLNLDKILGVRRLYVEFLALKRFQQVVPGSVPVVYFHDAHANCVVMEDLQSHEVLSSQIGRGHLERSEVRQLARVIAKLHRSTHIKTVPAAEFLTMLATFSNDEMVALNSDLTFTGMIDPGDPTNHCSPELRDLARTLRADPELCDRVQSLRSVFLGKKECLIHGDLHFGSIMVEGHSTKVIDAEFAFVGPAAADLGLVLANYVFHYAAHALYPTRDMPHFATRVREAPRVSVDEYFEEAAAYLNEKELKLLASHTAGFTGCHIIKWMIGAAEARDLLDKPQAELMCLRIGERLLREYSNIETTNDLFEHLCNDT